MKILYSFVILIEMLESALCFWNFWYPNKISEEIYQNILTSSNHSIISTNLIENNYFEVSNFLLFNQSQCLKDLWYTLHNLDSEWSMQLIDSYGKLPSGVLLGNLLWIGKYSECSDVSVPVNNETTGFNGMYCMAQWNISMPNKIHLPMKEIPIKTGICLPDSCRSVDLQKNWKYLLNFLYSLPFLKKFKGELKLISLNCKGKDFKIDDSSKIFLIILGLYLIVPVSASFITIVHHIRKRELDDYSSKQLTEVIFYEIPNAELNKNEELDIYLQREECEDDQNLIEEQYPSNKEEQKISDGFVPYVLRVLKCFCIFTNASQILNTSLSKKQFPCLHGIRFFSMTWVILGHTYIHNVNYIDNYLDLLKGINNLPFQAVMQGTFSVDTFFLIGGFLLGYLYLEEAEKRNGKINWLGLCLHRFLRITPVFAFLVAFASLIFKYLGNGPFWEQAEDISTCKEYWWWNILYINNFLPINHMCLTWTWYLANDMQFFIISSLALYILWRWKKLGIGLFSVLLGCSWMLTWYLSYIYDIPPLFMGISEVKNYTEYQEKLIMAWDMLYSKPYCRIGPHIIGILLAYFMYQYRGKKFSLNMSVQVLGWCIAAFCSVSVIYGVYYVKPTSSIIHPYNALGRSLFSVGVAWLIFCCLTEHAGVVNSFLSFKVWIPLSRLTYCAYLFHPLVMNWYFQQREVPLFFSHSTMVILFFSFLLLSYFVALIISIFLEAPIINLEKIVLKKQR